MSSFGSWVTELRFEFEPPLDLPEGSRSKAVTSFDLTPIASVPGIREQREQLLEQFVWDVLPGANLRGDDTELP